MAEHFADRLLREMRAKGAPVCVGLDPVYDKLPVQIREQHSINRAGGAVSAIREFVVRVLEVIAPHVACVKLNSAYFECHEGAGVDLYFEMVRRAADLGLLVIGDCKRADVGHTASAYAEAHLADRGKYRARRPDAITLHCYLGLDAINPFIAVAREQAKGLFVLVQTSNPSAATVQHLRDASNHMLCEHIAGMVNGWSQADGLIGESGYSAVGAVVAPTNVDLTRRLRALMPNCLFLVPGYGAQGRTAADTQVCFNPGGEGALVNASRSVIYAYSDPAFARQGTNDWADCVRHACRGFVADIARVAEW